MPSFAVMASMKLRGGDRKSNRHDVSLKLGENGHDITPVCGRVHSLVHAQ